MAAFLGEETNMKVYDKFYINGEWVEPDGKEMLDVINPATEEPCAKIAMGAATDVDRAVEAAKAAFETWSQTSVAERAEILGKVVAGIQARIGEIAEAISDEMGAPMWLANAAQAPAGLGHVATALDLLQKYEWQEQVGGSTIVKEPIGVCGFITPWNWPLNQITCKVAPALATGCTMVLKPSEIAPLDAMIFTEVLHDAGVPAGVFNLVNGDGPTVGASISAHPGVDMVSFTGSTRAGILVAKAAAETVKRVTQELGGKSANIILPNADLDQAVAGGVQGCFMNSGQSCNAPTRMLVPQDRHDEAVAIAKAAAEQVVVGDPKADGTTIGPVISDVQWNKIQGLIQKGIDEGADLVTGGTGKPSGLNVGYYVKPTIFANVSNDMTIAQEEIFGPVLSILPYKDVEDAIQIANDTEYGLSSYVSGGDAESAVAVGARLRAGEVHINGSGQDPQAPFGGYKKSGNGREWGKEGFEEYLEVKSLLGYQK
jgi:aldehyde dehydrogenase (NAD+)